MRILTLIGFSLAAALGFSGCSDNASEPGQSAAVAEISTDNEMPSADFSEFAGTWRLVSLGNGERLAADQAPRIRFEGDNVGGKAGCNSYTGGKNTDASSPALFGPMAATRMMCPDPQMAIENAYLKALSDVRSVRLDGASLVMAWENSEGAGELVFEPAPPLKD